MKLYFSNEDYKKKALEIGKRNVGKSKHSVGDAFLLLIKEIPKEDLSNLIFMIQEYFKSLTKPIDVSLDECYQLIQGKSVKGIEINETIKNIILDLAYECIESGKNLGERTIQDGKINTSSWMKHALYEAKLAGELANKLGVDSKTAQIQGMLHDYGRKMTHSFEHVTKGYEKLVDEGWEEEATACLTHSFLNGGRCATNDQAEEGFYVDENGKPMWRENAEKDDVTVFLENYQYNKYDMILNIADLMATSDGIVSPFERIEDIATRRTLDPVNRGYFLAEFTNTLVDVLKQMGAKVPEDSQEKIKALPSVSIDTINERFKQVSDLFFKYYENEISSDKKISSVSPKKIAKLDLESGITPKEMTDSERLITNIVDKSKGDR